LHAIGQRQRRRAGTNSTGTTGAGSGGGKSAASVAVPIDAIAAASSEILGTLMASSFRPAGAHPLPARRLNDAKNRTEVLIGV